MEEKQVQRIVTIGKIGIVALVGWWTLHSCASGSSDTTAVTSPARPSAADLRAKRQEAQAFWGPVVVSLGVAGAALNLAAQAAQNGDMVSAQQALSAAEKYADAASKASLNNAPDDDAWQGIGSDLYSSSNSYKKAIQEMRDGLATSNSEQMADALDDTQSANSDLSQATHDARVWYIRNGGKPSDIEDVAHAQRDALKLLKALSN